MVGSFIQHLPHVRFYAIVNAFTVCTPSQPTAHTSERCDSLKEIT